MVYIFFFNDTATTEIYTLSLHDALPILPMPVYVVAPSSAWALCVDYRRLYITHETIGYRDRKSTRLNSSHLVISYAVFCLKKKKQCPPRQVFPCCTESHEVLRHFQLTLS